MSRKLRIIKAPGVVLPNWDAFDAGAARYLPDGEVVEVSFRPEFKKDVVSGSAFPADVESARLCGVKFDASKLPKKTEEKPEKGSK